MPDEYAAFDVKDQQSGSDLAGASLAAHEGADQAVRLKQIVADTAFNGSTPCPGSVLLRAIGIRQKLRKLRCRLGTEPALGQTKQ